MRNEANRPSGNAFSGNGLNLSFRHDRNEFNDGGEEESFRRDTKRRRQSSTARASSSSQQKQINASDALESRNTSIEPDSESEESEDSEDSEENVDLERDNAEFQAGVRELPVRLSQVMLYCINSLTRSNSHNIIPRAPALGCSSSLVSHETLPLKMRRDQRKGGLLSQPQDQQGPTASRHPLLTRMALMRHNSAFRRPCQSKASLGRMPFEIELARRRDQTSSGPQIYQPYFTLD